MGCRIINLRVRRAEKRFKKLESKSSGLTLNKKASKAFDKFIKLKEKQIKRDCLPRTIK